MMRMKTWQKFGLLTAGSALVLSLALRLLSHVWWYGDTIWYRALIGLNAPAAKLERMLLIQLGIPRIYGVPLTMSETLIIEMTGIILGICWWFFLGAVGSIIWQRLAKRLINNRQ
jgi:hypothetical protein